MKVPPSIGTRVYIPTSWGSAFLIGDVVARPMRFAPTRTGWVWVQWLETSQPSHVSIEMLAPLPKTHHGTHQLTKLVVDDRTGELKCGSCGWSVFRYSLTDCPGDRLLTAKVLT